MGGELSYNAIALGSIWSAYPECDSEQCVRRERFLRHISEVLWKSIQILWSVSGVLKAMFQLTGSRKQTPMATQHRFTQLAPRPTIAGVFPLYARLEATARDERGLNAV